MEDKKMRDCSREIVKAQCETIGRLMRILFWGYGSAAKHLIFLLSVWRIPEAAWLGTLCFAAA